MTRYPLRWLIGASAVAVVLAAGILVAGRDPEGWTPAAPVPPSASSPSASSPRAEVVARRGVEVLHRWDRRRAAAYARGDIAALRGLYVDGAAAARADVAMLREYARRGLTVKGMRMQVLAVHVLEKDTDRYRLRVTDRLAGAVAVGPRTRVTLPRDRATTRVITLRRSGATWKVAAVRGAG